MSSRILSSPPRRYELRLAAANFDGDDEDYDEDITEEDDSVGIALDCDDDETIPTTASSLSQSSLLENITDEEALLACRAYLSRKNRLEWTEGKERLALRMRWQDNFERNDYAGSASSTSTTIADDNQEPFVGFFWENPDDLFEAVRRQDDDYVDMTDEQDDDESTGSDDANADERDDSDDDDTFDWRSAAVLDDYNLEWDEYEAQTATSYDNDILGTETSFGQEIQERKERRRLISSFSSKPKNPSKAFIRRSRAKKKMWQDPDFRKAWYEKRWGPSSSHPVMTDEERTSKKWRSILSRVPTSVLNSPEFDRLTEEEIEEAIISFRQTNQLTSQKNKEWHQLSEYERRMRASGGVPFGPSPELLESLRVHQYDHDDDAAVNGQASHGDAKDFPFHILVQPNRTVYSEEEEINRLKKRQEKRSETARRIYRIRLANQRRNRRAPVAIPLPRFLPTTQTAKAAIERISAYLDALLLPLASDIELIIPPGALKRRREVLRRILDEHFDERGRVIPVYSSFGDDDDDDDDRFVYVTHAPIEWVGRYVLEKVRKATKEAGESNAIDKEEDN